MSGDLKRSELYEEMMVLVWGRRKNSTRHYSAISRFRSGKRLAPHVRTHCVNLSDKIYVWHSLNDFANHRTLSRCTEMIIVCIRFRNCIVVSNLISMIEP